MSPTSLILLLVAAAALAVVLWLRMPALVGGQQGRLVLLLTLLVLPFALMQFGMSRSLSGSTEKSFCVSCHEMQVYDTSLHIDDPEFVPALHYQNRYVPQETACYTCHTDYTMYGDVTAKINGLKHVWVHFFGTVPEAGAIELYQPYPNDNCLQCHRGARRFERRPAHRTEGVTLEALYANEKSCVGGGCHDKIHDIRGLGRHDLWGDVTFPVPEGLMGGGSDDADDPFADDPFADDPADAKPPGERPATELDSIDDLFDDPPAPPPDAPAPPADAPTAPREAPDPTGATGDPVDGGAAAEPSPSPTDGGSP